MHHQHYDRDRDESNDFEPPELYVILIGAWNGTRELTIEIWSLGDLDYITIYYFFTCTFVCLFVFVLRLLA